MLDNIQMGQIDRINQLEAHSTDDYFKNTLLSNLTGVFKYFPPGTVQSYSAELSALLDYLYYRLTIARDLQ